MPTMSWLALLAQLDDLLPRWTAPAAAWPAVLDLVRTATGMETAWLAHREAGGPWRVAARAGDDRPAAECLPTGTPEDEAGSPPVQVTRDGTGRMVVRVPFRRANRAWAMLVLSGAPAAPLDDPEALAGLRHVGTLLGLWDEYAQIADPSPASARHARLQSLYRALLGSQHVVFLADGEAEILALIVQRVMDSGLFSAVAVAAGEAPGALRYRVAAGLSPAGGALSVDDWPSPPRQACETGRLVAASADGWPDAWRRAAAEAGWQVWVSVPVRRGDGIWGTLDFFADTLDLCDAEVFRVLERTADLLGHSLDEWEAKRRLLEAEARHRHLAYHDSLTGLPNRAAFLRRLSEAVSRARREGTQVAVVLLDLDDFKPVNDTYGHMTGDAVLQAVARRLQSELRQHDLAARLGGDEFALVLEGLRRPQDVAAVLDKLSARLAEPILVEDGTVSVTVPLDVSLGATLYPWDAAEPADLVRHADLSLYVAKEHKTRRARPWQLYQPLADDPASYGRWIPDGVRVHYQPIVRLRTGRVEGLEALVRLWDGRRALAPAAFLPALSPRELGALTDAVVARVLEDMAALDRALPQDAPWSVAVNLEPAWLTPESIARLEAQVRTTGVAPARLTLELMENTEFLSQDAAKTHLGILKDKQFGVALDDVGSAYSSLLRIKELPIDTLKLDPRFVRGIAHRPDDLLFVLSVQTLARGFHARFVAEGVETVDLLDALRVLGVDSAQGYVFTPPLPLEDCVAWIRAWRPDPADGAPRTLLGAYAAHLVWRFVADGWPDAMPAARAPASACPLHAFLAAHGGRGTLVDQAHRADHAARAADRAARHDALRDAVQAARQESPLPSPR